MPNVNFVSDVVVQTSDNERTPVALIEAQAASLPVVATGVGGVASAVVDGETARITALGDNAAMADAISSYLDDPITSRERGKQGRRHVLTSFTPSGLIATVDRVNRGALDGGRS
jgi:glycosyltransferase involved in cell wall biosynthesis